MDALDLTLKVRHLFPTSPDTLRSYPFVNEDPFVLTELPNIYFAGNQPEYSTKKVQLADDMVCRLICVPSFRRSKSIVLVDLQNLQSYEYKFDCSLVANRFDTDQLEFDTNEDSDAHTTKFGDKNPRIDSS